MWVLAILDAWDLIHAKRLLLTRTCACNADPCEAQPPRRQTYPRPIGKLICVGYDFAGDRGKLFALLSTTQYGGTTGYHNLGILGTSRDLLHYVVIIRDHRI